MTTDDSVSKTCGAKNRSSKPCKLPAGTNGRCRFHGGRSTGPLTPKGKSVAAQNSRKHGIYSRGYTSEELPVVEELRSVDDLAQELSLARVILGRAIMAAPHPIGVAVASGRAGPDWWAIIDRCLGRVGRLCEQQCRVHDIRKLEEEMAERLTQLEEAVKNREEM
jgi:hypothetical protein